MGTRMRCGRDVGWPFADLVGTHYLGPLSSSVITRKEGHKIIDAGPYALMRHPIYTGLIIALLATAAAEGRVTALWVLRWLSLAFGGRPAPRVIADG